MTVTLTARRDVAPFVLALVEAAGIALDPWQRVLLEHHAPAPLSGLDDPRVRRAEVAAASALSTSLVRLRDELDHDVQNLHNHMEALDADLAAYMWAHLTLGLTETDVMDGCAALLEASALVDDYTTTAQADMVRARIESLALAALQGWSDRLARPAANR